MSDDDEVIPRLGDYDDVRLALTALRAALGRSPRAPDSDSAGAPASDPAWTERERALMRLISVQARMSALLIQQVEHSSSVLTVEYLLERLEDDARMRAELGALDTRPPFDA